jgi:hypothetical protein
MGSNRGRIVHDVRSILRKIEAQAECALQVLTKWLHQFVFGPLVVVDDRGLCGQDRSRFEKYLATLAPHSTDPVAIEEKISSSEIKFCSDWTLKFPR